MATATINPRPIVWREPLLWMLAALPLALACWLWQAGDVWTFVASAAAIVPLAGWMGRATENLADSLSPALGGLLNATFGNAAEMIIGLVAISKGPHMYPLVKASLTGSIIGNVLLVLGAAVLAGGLRYREQRFNLRAARMNATLFVLAASSLVVPALFHQTYSASGAAPSTEASHLGSLSVQIAIVLAMVYLLSLVFSLGTHRELLSGISPETTPPPASRPHWSVARSLTILVGATIGVAVMSELMVGSVERTAHALGMNDVFVGVIVVAVVGNAAEHSTAVLMAWHDRIEVAVHIAIGSGLQIALFVAPSLVLASFLFAGQQPLDLLFTRMELIAVAISAAILVMVATDGETNWMEGVLLLAVYLILALAFYQLPVS
ncbi:MAG TPA: calcium/proton exchanger [Pirellulales bacterium]|nr:calcium/proton exchanger [Pirellulales bacterium]